jgi:hypothetical protein
MDSRLRGNDELTKEVGQGGSSALRLFAHRAIAKKTGCAGSTVFLETVTNQLFSCFASTSLSLYESKIPASASRIENFGAQPNSDLVLSIFGTRFCTSW